MSANLPPGCGKLPGEAPDRLCAICKADPYDCTCPDCSICGPGDPKCTHVDHPVKRAVMPLLRMAEIRAEQEAQRIINKFKAELEAAGGDSHQAAPYPSVRDNRVEYRHKEQRYNMLRSLTKPLGDGIHKRHGPELRVMCEKKCSALIREYRDTARMQYLMYVQKLLTKVGEGVTDAKLDGDHVWSSSVLTVMKGASTERWRTTQIVNVSSRGKLFNQWPTRKLKEDS